jgi:hypothetical protein
MYFTTERSWEIKQVGEVPLLLELSEEVDHLRLDRHVQRRDRLVGTIKVRGPRQRPGDAYPLALPPENSCG